MAVELVTEDRDGVRILRINRPEARNALNPVVVRALGAGLLAADRDEDVRAVVVSGTGDRAFCAGMDLREFSDENTADEGFEADYTTFLRQGIEKPVVAAVNATAVAGGFELVLACDMAVAADTARFGLPEVKRGLFAAGGGTQLSRRIPLAVALEMGLTGDFVDAARAHALGLVNRLVPQAEVLDAAVDLARMVAVNAPLAVRVTKQLMVAAASVSPEEAWRQRDDVFDQVFDSADAHEGSLAFVERREPLWTGV